MACWAFTCKHCQWVFTCSKIGETLADFIAEEKPKLPPEGVECICPHCKTKGTEGIATNLSIERVRWAAQGESRHYRAARPGAGSKVFERLDLSSTCHIACHSAVELQAHSAGQKTGASSAGRHDRIPAATIFVEGVKSASIPQWTTLDVSPLRKGPQQLSRPRSDAVALCSGPKAPLINTARTVKGKSRTLCVRPSCEYIRRQFFDKGETPHLQSQNRREESLFGDHCNVLNGNAVYSEKSSG